MYIRSYTRFFAVLHPKYYGKNCSFLLLLQLPRLCVVCITKYQLEKPCSSVLFPVPLLRTPPPLPTHQVFKRFPLLSCRTWSWVCGLPRRTCANARCFSLGSHVFLYVVYCRTWQSGQRIYNATIYFDF